MYYLGARPHLSQAKATIRAHAHTYIECSKLKVKKNKHITVDVHACISYHMRMSSRDIHTYIEVSINAPVSGNGIQTHIYSHFTGTYI